MVIFNLKFNLFIYVYDLFYILLYKFDFKSFYMYYEIGKIMNEK